MVQGGPGRAGGDRPRGTSRRRGSAGTPPSPPSAACGRDGPALATGGRNRPRKPGKHGGSPPHFAPGRKTCPLAGAFWRRGARFVRLWRSEEHTSELQSLMRNSYAVFCLKKKNTNTHTIIDTITVNNQE